MPMPIGLCTEGTQKLEIKSENKKKKTSDCWLAVVCTAPSPEQISKQTNTDIPWAEDSKVVPPLPHTRSPFVLPPSLTAVAPCRVPSAPHCSPPTLGRHCLPLPHHAHQQQGPTATEAPIAAMAHFAAESHAAAETPAAAAESPTAAAEAPITYQGQNLS